MLYYPGCKVVEFSPTLDWSEVSQMSDWVRERTPFEGHLLQYMTHHQKIF